MSDTAEPSRQTSKGPVPDPRLKRVARAERLAHVMDRAVRVPGTQIRLGLDSILGIVPGVGDTLALAPSAYIMSEAHRLGVPRSVLMRMAANLGVDWLIGLVPLVGDLFDVGWKANMRNVALMRRHVEHSVDHGSGDYGTGDFGSGPQASESDARAIPRAGETGTGPTSPRVQTGLRTTSVHAHAGRLHR